MNGSEIKKISGLKTLLSSINNDYQVYRWFLFLIMSQQVRTKIKELPLWNALYSFLNRYIFIHWLVTTLFLSSLIIAIKHPFFLLFNIALIIPLYVLHRNKKRLVVQLAEALLKNDFSQTDLNQKTLYQIAEILSRNYKIPSLVDVIYNADQFIRKSVIFMFVLSSFILFLKLWQLYLIIAATYFIVYLLFNSFFIFKTLK
jgi:hypothetical protein